MKKRKIRLRIGAGIVLLGLLVLLFPQGQRILTEQEQKKALAEAGAVIGRMKGFSSEWVDGRTGVSGDSIEGSAEEACGPSPDGSFPMGELTEEAKAFYEACAGYNEELFAGGQKNLVDLESVEDFPLRAADYGYPEEVIGVLTVPRLEVELPLYLGASKEHMALGAALFGQTSVPMSGSDHALSAICAHRGYRGTPMFREIERMQVGDPIFVATPWEYLEYHVTETRVVLPNDTSWCRIEEGKNQIVLMTCHPYRRHTHRYLVFAELVVDE